MCQFQSLKRIYALYCPVLFLILFYISDPFAPFLIHSFLAFQFWMGATKHTHTHTYIHNTAIELHGTDLYEIWQLLWWHNMDRLFSSSFHILRSFTLPILIWLRLFLVVCHAVPYHTHTRVEMTCYVVRFDVLFIVALKFCHVSFHLFVCAAFGSVSQVFNNYIIIFDSFGNYGEYRLFCCLVHLPLFNE